MSEYEKLALKWQAGHSADKISRKGGIFSQSRPAQQHSMLISYCLIISKYEKIKNNTIQADSPLSY